MAPTDEHGAGYLRPVMKRKNLTVRTNAHATKILFEDKTAKGIRYSEGGRYGIETDIFARREVILSGGAVNSPHLLQLSGIGAPELRVVSVSTFGSHSLALAKICVIITRLVSRLGSRIQRASTNWLRGRDSG